MKKQEEKMKKVYLLLLSLVVLMIALTGCGKDTDSAKDNSKPITLRYSTMQNKDHISYQVALNIKQAVEEKTEGRVLIDIYPANQLGDWSQVYDELMMGSIDMAHSSVPETYDARTAVGYFPYLSSSYDQLGEIFAEGSSLDNMMKEIQAKNGIEFCGFFVEGIAGIGTTKEVSNPNTLDSKNTVIRTAAMDCYSCSIATPHLNSTTTPSFLTCILSTSIFMVVPSTVVSVSLCIVCSMNVSSHSLTSAYLAAVPCSSLRSASSSFIRSLYSLTRDAYSTDPISIRCFALCSASAASCS